MRSHLAFCLSFIYEQALLCENVFVNMIFETENPKAHQYSATFKASGYLQFSTNLRYFDNSMFMHFQSLFKSPNAKLHRVRTVRHSNINKNAEAADSRRAADTSEQVAQSTRRQKQKWTQGREGRDIPCATA